jgi:hypothetical protein
MDENITPLAKKLAEENSIDWRFIRGTGPAGKVIERDILSYLARIMSGELDLPVMPDASEPAGPAAGSANMPDMGQVANFDLMSASMAKEGVDLNSMLGDFAAPAAVETPPVPEYDFSLPINPVSSVTDDVVISSQVAGVQVPEVAAPEVIVPEIAAPTLKATEPEDTVFEFDLDDIDEVEPVAALHNPDLFPAEIATPAITMPSSSLDEDHIMTVNDDHDVVVSSDEVTLSSGNDDIPVHVSGEFEPVPDPLENVPFELDAQSHYEPVQTLIVEDAILAPEPELVVDEVATPTVHHEPTGLSLEGLAAVGAGVLGVGAALGHVPSVNDLELELETPVAAMPVLPVEPEPVVAPVIAEPEIVPVMTEPMIAHFDPEPVHVPAEPVVAAEPEPVHIPEPVVALEPEPVYVEPEPVHVPEPVVALEPEPVHVPAEPVQTPIVVPAAIETLNLDSSSQHMTVAAPTFGVHKDFFNTNILRRQFHASALMDIRTQISKALNGREVQLGVFVGRAAQRGLYLLGTTDAVTLNKLEAGLVPLSTAGLHHSFIEAVQSVNHADAGAPNGLAVLDASNLGVDDLVLPASGALLALGQISNNMGTLTLSGDFPAKAGAEFLAHVAGALETPVGLVL